MNKPKALIVDDDANIRNLIATVLRREEFETEQAEDGEQAIEKLSADPRYDVILVDLMMPKVDGLGVIAFLQKNRPETMSRVVLMTAFARSAVERIGFACPILPKPFDLRALLSLVREKSGHQSSTA